MKKFVFVLIVITTLTACGSSKNMGKLVGADRDEHDCIGSAGYTWSDALHQCIRIWEVGERFEAGQKNIFLFLMATQRMLKFSQIQIKFSASVIRHSTTYGCLEKVLRTCASIMV